MYLSCTPTVDAVMGDYITLRGKRGDGADWKPLRPLKEGTDHLPAALKYLGEYAFYWISFQESDVVLPASLEYYGDEALSWNIIVGFKVEEGNTILRCENGMLLDADYRRPRPRNPKARAEAKTAA